MAKTSMVQKWLKEPKFPGRAYNRCNRCFRPRGYIRHAGLCRICFREMALNGELPGVRKASL
ncbi:MAG: type Z 30S ribosomal protein S14 [Chloroflexota bacterium]|nr:type Z 30S ribosomal protein S14 [Chloroflexota bacterium]MCH2672006.1 type Z 30S ribosomal protein S14 [Dehalococcoidia bacterium]MED5208880.1 type Z 30S ribosomal protein S14 [Chloroflexota bacterium]MEE3014374.1 type Z 30S ribosomal protein S14 [Chloroflexota bacterium]